MWHTARPVSYTHLDVYKRQGQAALILVALSFAGAALVSLFTMMFSELTKNSVATIGKMCIRDRYERLSRDDEQAGESNSIQNQKMYLEEYARQKGLRLSLIHI